MSTQIPTPPILCSPFISSTLTSATFSLRSPYCEPPFL
jgi:hypothetical protein